MKDILFQNEPLGETNFELYYTNFAPKTDDLKIQNDTKIAIISSSIQDPNLKVNQNRADINSELREISKKSDNIELPPPNGHTINNIEIIN